MCVIWDKQWKGTKQKHYCEVATVHKPNASMAEVVSSSQVYLDKEVLNAACVVDSTFQGPIYGGGPSLTTIVDKGLLHFDWILVDYRGVK